MRVWQRATLFVAGVLVVVPAAWKLSRYAYSVPNHPGSAAVTVTGPAPEAQMRLACAPPSHRISPLVYGIAYYPPTDAKDRHVWGLEATARRWGGNHTSRYNWRLGNAWNAGSDWFFRNLDYIGRPGYSWRDFLAENRAHGVATALTVPMLEWVAKDTRSASFPAKLFREQQALDPYQPDAGNGLDRRGKALRPLAPERTSVRSGPEDVGAWVKAIRTLDRKKGWGRSVDIYILDNEPMVWHKTHRDVHPEPVGYDELLARTKAYARAIRRADPQAKIAGPAVWGWPAYFFSAKDQEAGFFLKPDRRAHGDVPLLAWYLRELRAHEQRTGERLLDILDVHFYPQEVPKNGADEATRAWRLRSTRALWDSTYEDESWIDDRVMLLPRMSQLIAENYPGLGLAIGEYNFFGENDMSGALALAEALGRFGQHAGLSAAFYWSYPPAGSPAFAAFRAYRDFDSRGAAFEELSLRTEAPAGTSLFASRDNTGGRVVAVALNLDAKTGREGVLQLDGCAAASSVRAFAYAGAGTTLRPARARFEAAQVRVTLPPYSITVLEITTAAVAGQ